MAGRPGSFEKWLVPEGAHHKGRASFVWGVFFFVCGVDFVGSILCVLCVLCVPPPKNRNLEKQHQRQTCVTHHCDCSVSEWALIPDLYSTPYLAID
jgi:hypothetical protein